MTPKEYAENLINEFMKIEVVIGYDLQREQALQCARIAVDRIIKSNTNVTGCFLNGDYWQEVLKEIN